MDIRRNLSALNKYGGQGYAPLKIWLLCFFLGIPGRGLIALDWYISNAGGMALEPAFSRVALRSKYALSVGSSLYADLPLRLRKYYDGSYRIELRVLYEGGEISRRQWSFQDEVGVIRLVAVLQKDHSGFIEQYNSDRLITESHRIEGDGSDYITNYLYNRGFLIRAETRLFTPNPPPPEPEDASAEAEAGKPAAAPEEEKEPEGSLEDLWTDYYRYNRSSALRGVERQFHRSPPGENPEPALIRFPQLILGIWGENEFVQPGSVFNSEFFEDVIINSGDRILYTTDDRGRILSEVRRDEKDQVLGEVHNTWSGDRLTSVLWSSGDEDRLVEYEYNSQGDRVFERNFRNGTLERTVRQEGEREVEELYMNGTVMLRAIWENGRKISEERVRSAPVRTDRGRTLPGGQE
jgi:hypothetical protein